VATAPVSGVITRRTERSGSEKASWAVSWNPSSPQWSEERGQDQRHAYERHPSQTNRFFRRRQYAASPDRAGATPSGGLLPCFPPCSPDASTSNTFAKAMTSPRDPVPVRAAIARRLLVVVLHDRQLDRLGHQLRSKPMRRPERPVVSQLILLRRRIEPIEEPTGAAIASQARRSRHVSALNEATAGLVRARLALRRTRDRLALGKPSLREKQGGPVQPTRHGGRRRHPGLGRGSARCRSRSELGLTK